MTSTSANHIQKIGFAIVSTIGGLSILQSLEKRQNDKHQLGQYQKNQTSLTVSDQNLKLRSFQTSSNDVWDNVISHRWSLSSSLLPVIQCEAETPKANGNHKDVGAALNLPTQLKPPRLEEEFRALSRAQRILHSCGLLRTLPTPRLLTSKDPLFDYPGMKAGLKQRSRDEKELRNLQAEAIEARNSKSPERIHEVFLKVSQIAYGLSPQDRENFMTRYGCTAWTEEILNFIEVVSKDRGIVEIGAGNGQWARALIENRKKTNNDVAIMKNSHDDYILAYDTMQELPLSPKVYHSHTQPAHDYFYNKVQKCSSHTEAVRKMSSRGRVLMLVYPPPGPMALETIKAYVDVYPQGNDTVIYVGEGRGGANGNDELFDYLCNDSGEWTIIKVMDVRKSLKGYEKCFCFQRVKKKMPTSDNL